MVSTSLSPTSRPSYDRADTPSHPSAFRRVQARIPSNHSGSSFDTVRRTPLEGPGRIVYASIRSDRPGTSYDSARRVYEAVPDAPSEDVKHPAEVSLAASISSSVTSYQVTSSIWLGAQSESGAAGDRLDLIQP